MEKFITIQGGVGYGGGISDDPSGDRPKDGGKNDRCAGVAGLGVFAQAGIGLGPVLVSSAAGTGTNLNGSTPHYAPYSYGGGSAGLESGWKLRAGASVGLEGSFYVYKGHIFP